YDTVLRYYAIWAANRDVVKDFLLVRYEDMRQDTRRELRRVLDFLGLPGVAEAVVAEAVEFASFENMRKMETEDRFQSRKLRAADAREAESFKTRRGKVGGYADYLAPDDVEYLNRRMAEILPDFYGYRP
ncbi:MAG TPA: sulfotransferase domain-containing protein, partial [bacterium]